MLEEARCQVHVWLMNDEGCKAVVSFSKIETSLETIEVGQKSRSLLCCWARVDFPMVDLNLI